MRAIYRLGAPELSGVYSIRNLVDGMLYIGSAKKFSQRHVQHKRDLRKRKHCNKRLQAAYNKYGPDAFVFEPICVVDGDTKARADKEQEFLDCFLEEGEETWRRHLYNHVKKTVRTQGPWSSTPEETKDKISKDYVLSDPTGNIISFRNMTRFCRERGLGYPSISALWCGKIKYHKGYHLPAIPNPEPKTTYSLINPEGNEVTFASVKDFCRENNLEKHGIWSVLANKQPYHRGYHLPGTPRPRTYTLVDSEGNEVTFTNIKRFCRENGLDEDCIHRVLTTKQPEHRGYYLPGNKPENKPIHVIIDSEGKTHTFTNITAFARQNGLDRESLRSVLVGKRIQHRQWRLPETEIPAPKTYIFISPDNNTIIVNNLKRFCRDNNLSEPAMRHVNTGTQQQHKGWTAKKAEQ
jgi:group I intron endonuclease